MELKVSNPNSKTLLLEIAGRFDAHTVDKAKSAWLTNEAASHIIVDLSRTTFIDSMGLATLVSGLKLAKQRGGTLILARPADVVQVILELTTMNQVFQIALSVDEALGLI